MEQDLSLVVSEAYQLQMSSMQFRHKGAGQSQVERMR